MTSEVAAFDPNAFRNRVKDHVVNSFGALLPEEQFAKMVNEAIEDFFNSSIEMTLRDAPSSSSFSAYGRKVISAPITPFKQMVWQTLLQMVGERLNKYMHEDQVKHPINKFLDELFMVPEFENMQVLTAQQMMIAMAGQFFQQQLQQAGLNAKSSIANAFQNAGMPDMAQKIWNS